MEIPNERRVATVIYLLEALLLAAIVTFLFKLYTVRSKTLALRRQGLVGHPNPLQARRQLADSVFRPCHR